jgi:hypothetical protein
MTSAIAKPSGIRPAGLPSIDRQASASLYLRGILEDTPMLRRVSEKALVDTCMLLDIQVMERPELLWESDRDELEDADDQG